MGRGGESRVHTERFHLSCSGRLVCLELTGFILHPLGCLREVNEGAVRWWALQARPVWKT